MKRKIFIIGAGTGDIGLLTKKASSLIRECDEVFGTLRICECISPLRRDIICCSITEMAAKINASQAAKIAVLVSGDTGFFSLKKSLLKQLDEEAEIESVCGISSLQYLCAKLDISYENIEVVSLHGRDGNILGRVAYNPYVFVLTGGSVKAQDVCKQLCEYGLEQIAVTAGEMLSMERERIIKGTARELSSQEFDDLTVLLIENPHYVEHDLPLKDSDFIRENVPMTKEEVRWITVAKLAVLPDDVVYDIGAGTGSVAIELARKAYRGLAFAIEKEEIAVELIKRNRKNLGAYNLVAIADEAPAGLESLPTPNKAFIGGSSGNLREIVELLVAKNPNVRIAVNAVTLETLTQSLNVLSDIGFKTDVVCINAARAKKVGGYNMMMANNPVYIITGDKDEKQC
jgi:precorrin-6Y C5,15-methyltransferase (decarboxylating)